MMLDFSQFSLNGTPPSPPAKRPKVSNLRGVTAPFIKGPIPLAWMKAAAMLPGKSPHVALVLWYLAGLKKTRTVALGNRLLKSFGVDRKAKGRCLKAMQGAGLITVVSRAGCNPIVTLLDAPEPVRQENKGAPNP